MLWESTLEMKIFFFFLFGFSFTHIGDSQTAGEGGGHLFSSSLPLPPVSQTLRH